MMMIRRTVSTIHPTMGRLSSNLRASTAAAAAVGSSGSSSDLHPHLLHGSSGCNCSKCGCLNRRSMSTNSSSTSSVEPDWVRTAIQKMILDQSENVNETISSSATTTTTASSLSSSSTERTSASTMMNGTTNGTTTTTTPPLSVSSSLFVSFENPDLEKTLQSLQNQLQEAEACIQDCYECVINNNTTTDINELQNEIDAADHSIDVAVAHFVDLLDAKKNQQQQQSSSLSSTSNASHSRATSSVAPTNHYHSNIPTDDLVKRIKHLRGEIAKLKLVQQQSIMTKNCKLG